jgi:glycosyltransferase involved in cell wall biosynthesis
MDDAVCASPQNSASRAERCSQINGGADRTLVVSTPYQHVDIPREIGHEAYSYHFVYKAFAPLLERWAKVQEIDRPESRLDFALWNARKQGRQPFHLSLLPLHMTYLTPNAPAAAFPFWEFPDLPNVNLENNPRNNWVHIAERLQLLLTACRFTRDAFVRSGVRTPIEIVPVPINDNYFRVRDWNPGQRIVLDVPAYIFPEPEAPVVVTNPWKNESGPQSSLLARVRHNYRASVRPRLPAFFDRGMSLAFQLAHRYRAAREEETRVAAQASSSLTLEGVIYTTILNPFDGRKNWKDLLTGFVHAFVDRPDALLVVKLVLPQKLMVVGLNRVLKFYRAMGFRHKCRIAFLPGYLTQEQMFDLTRGTTFYVNTAKAEGSCLPLQDYLAAGRPGIAPVHTAFADYFDQGIGFPLQSHPEPAWWPHDPLERYSTSWHRLVWQSWVDQLRASYEIATGTPAKYASIAIKARERMENYASGEKVWPLLKKALDTLAATQSNAVVDREGPESLRRAS